MVRALSEQEIKDVARRGLEELRGGRKVGDSAVNQHHARRLPDDQGFVFRGHRLTVRPLPFEDGLKLMELASIVQNVHDRLQDGGKADESVFRAYSLALSEILMITHRVIRPRWVPGFIWAWVPSPVRGCSQSEVMELLRFCARCQMTPRSPSGTRAA